MTDESDDIQNIFETIINNPDRWDEIHFIRQGKKQTIKAVDQYGSKYSWSEELA